MVATRRGVRVYSPTKTSPERPPDVQATPSTGRRTRRTARQEESPTQHALVETSSQLEESEGGLTTPSASNRRCTRASRLHSPEQPCTPAGSIHEADISDIESCCSVVSDTELPITRNRRRIKVCTANHEDVSDAESCSSAVSATKSSQNTRRRMSPAKLGAKADPEPESCSSPVSESTMRVTRSQRKSARTRSSTKRQTEDSEVSDVDSCASSVSGTALSRSTTRRATRSHRQTCPIPMHLKEATESPHSPAPSGRRTRAASGKMAVAADLSEPQSCDSEGFESGPTYSMNTRRRGRTQSRGPIVVDSDSEPTDAHSTVSNASRSRGTPCSSRTGSGNSSRGVPASRHAVKELSIVLEKGGEPPEEDALSHDSTLESTVIAEVADCTLLEGDESHMFEEENKEGGDSGVKVILEEDSHVGEAAVTTRHQQEELSAEKKCRDTSEMEVMQETVPSSESTKPCQSVTVTICESVCETTAETEEKDEVMEVVDVNTRPSQGVESLDGSAASDMQPSKEEKMEVSAVLSTDVQQVVDSSEDEVESAQVNISQEHKITVDAEPEQAPKDVIVQKKNIISLLDSSEDDYSEEEENEEEEEVRVVSGEEEEEVVGHEAEKSGGAFMKPEAAESVEGLFMIDTRPGQEADEDYYKEQLASKKEGGAEQEEEFLDEEEEDDDEDAEVLFSSRNPQLKELSSRIDPGIRVKELGGLYISFDGSKSKPVSSSLQKLKEKRIQDEVMKKSVIGPDFEKKDAVPPYSESKQAMKLKRRAEREKSTGDGWFNMKAPEVTPELKGDLQVLKMRGSMDSKRFYKKNDRDGFPKYFQVGTVVDSAVDFYHSRIPKKERKRTMVEELLADAEFRQKNKKKYQQIVAEKAAQGAGKRNKKKNKFHKK